VNRLLADYVEQHPTSACLAANLGTQGYFSLMALAAAMVGNSSSGITEAPSFELPVVNVGSRQTGRIKGMNVIDVKCSRASIRRGLRKALSEEFRASLQGMANPYQKANASKTIVEVLGTVPLDEKLIVKRFHDSTVAVSGGSS
jgi:UDP-N-acetylglucosamine 2-epimerase